MQRKALMRLEYEGLHKTDAITTAGARYAAAAVVLIIAEQVVVALEVVVVLWSLNGQISLF